MRGQFHRNKQLNNPDLNTLEFEGFKNQAGQIYSGYLRSKELKLKEQLFNYGKFATIKSKAVLHSYRISTREWFEKANAIGIKATAGRYKGTGSNSSIKCTCQFVES